MADYPMPGNVEFNAAQEQQQRSNQAIQNSMIASMTKSPSAPAAAAATPAAKDSNPASGTAGGQFLAGMQKPSDIGSKVAGIIGNAGSGGGGGTTMGSNNAIDPSTVDAAGSLPALY